LQIITKSDWCKIIKEILDKKDVHIHWMEYKKDKYIQVCKKIANINTKQPLKWQA